MDLSLIIDELASVGLLDADLTESRPLSGGVSSDICLLDDGRHQLVVKQALAQLRVSSEWKADVGRNDVEQRYLKFVGGILPETVPAVRYVSKANHFFAMDYFGNGFQPWKKRLLAGHAEPEIARAAAAVLGKIHRSTWGCENVRTEFETTPWFDQLRLDPYLRTIGVVHPGLRPLIDAEVARITATRLCLVHGDFSPKNLLVAPGRVVVIDAEVAWFGDPTFDVAFLLNHLVLKALHMPACRHSMIDMARLAWQGYVSEIGHEHLAMITPNLPRLLLMLMLARVDGKSPVEYLSSEEPKQRVRTFVMEQLNHIPADLDRLLDHWLNELDRA